MKDDKELAAKIDAAPHVVLTPVVIAELWFGGMLRPNAAKIVRDITAFITRFEVVPVDSKAAIIWGEQKALLRKKGITIPDNDIWIAAIALCCSLSVVTRDRHFTFIDALDIISW